MPQPNTPLTPSNRKSAGRRAAWSIAWFSEALESCCILHKQASNMLLCDVLLKSQSKKYTIENQIPFSYEIDF